jgi:hypothetical protein
VQGPASLFTLEELSAAGADIVYFHVHDVDDLGHIGLLGSGVLSQVS